MTRVLTGVSRQIWVPFKNKIWYYHPQTWYPSFDSHTEGFSKMWVPPNHPNHRPFKYWNCCFLRNFRGTFSFWEPRIWYATSKANSRVAKIIHFVSGLPFLWSKNILLLGLRCDRVLEMMVNEEVKIPKTMNFDGLQSGFVNECEWIYLVSVQSDYTLMLDMAQRVQGSGTLLPGVGFPDFCLL